MTPKNRASTPRAVVLSSYQKLPSAEDTSAQLAPAIPRIPIRCSSVFGLQSYMLRFFLGGGPSFPAPRCFEVSEVLGGGGG